MVGVEGSSPWASYDGSEAMAIERQRSSNRPRTSWPTVDVEAGVEFRHQDNRNARVGKVDFLDGGKE